MAHTYNILSQWQKWLAQHALGQSLIDIEIQHIAAKLSRHFGKNAVVLGVPSQFCYLNATTIPCHFLVTPLHHHNQKQHACIESHFQELPFLTASVDLVILPHTHEFIDSPRQLITESCRIVKPEGLILIIGFNPYSLWRLERLMYQSKKMPWKAQPIPPQEIKNWLQLNDFSIENFSSLVHRPLLKNTHWFKRLSYLDRIGNFCTPNLGSVYTLLARAKVLPLTPIKLKWSQKLDQIRASTSFSGYITR